MNELGIHLFEISLWLANKTDCYLFKLFKLSVEGIQTFLHLKGRSSLEAINQIKYSRKKLSSGGIITKEICCWSSS